MEDLAHALTPESLAVLITAILGGVAVLLASVGTLIASIIGARRGAQVLVKTQAIEHATNGAAAAAASAAAAAAAAATKRALEDTVAGLREQLVEAVAARLEAAAVAKQAATDARATTGAEDRNATIDPKDDESAR